MRTTRTALAGAAGLAALLGPAAPVAALALDPSQPPRSITGEVIRNGADGRPRELFCPASQNAYSGGFTVSAREGARLAQEPADLIESRPNQNSTGWIVTVRKSQIRPQHHRLPHGEPADLVIHVVCTEGTPAHGM